jgi:alpha-L-rhamnosidase
MSIFEATWICEQNEHESPVFRKRFSLREVKAATLDICGLGWFYCYVNGQVVTDAIFEPAISTYERLKDQPLAYPIKDVFAPPRVYYCRYDVTALLREGKTCFLPILATGGSIRRGESEKGIFLLARRAFAIR